MTWPNTYKDQYEVTQRAIRILVPYAKHLPVDLAKRLAEELGDDVEVVCEIAEATGALDNLLAEVEAIGGSQ